jgi:hypothetical protein
MVSCAAALIRETHATANHNTAARDHTFDLIEKHLEKRPETAKHAENAEKDFLCELRVLRG